MTRILGIDPGSRLTGFGVIDVAGQRLSYVASGCIRIGDGALARRLQVIHEGVTELVATYRPGETVIENVFMQRNAAAALKLGQARGAAICALAGGGLPVHEYTPAQIKQAVVGKGNAAKVQVQHMVQALLGLAATPPADAADALACAICHSHFRRMGEHLAAPLSEIKA
ncbi:MAG: crossover junction endodeoxyribonuclease RuvC [Gammaproteobacteria bacterium]